ncbi:MAG: glycoside hydrolase family 97 catalytic domain-containing protein [Clostridiales bacterium]|nr:glycoside hydrolase family 97 catalytic domain-containing protein [Clostridiales bacterium]
MPHSLPEPAGGRSDLCVTVSPNGLLSLTIYIEDGGRLFYRVDKASVAGPTGVASSVGATGSAGPATQVGSIAVIEPSSLGIKTGDTDFYDGMAFVSTEVTSWNNTYSIPGGKKSVYVDNAVQREYVVQKDSRPLKIIIRAYDDGIAFRYRIPGPGAANVEKEYTECRLPDGTGGWGHPWVNTYEGFWQYYDPASLAGAEVTMPFLASINGGAVWALLTEASVYNADGTYCPSVLKGSAGGHMQFSYAADQSAYGDRLEVALPFQTPFRAAIIAGSLNELVNSTLAENLNPAPKIADTSWIRPGRAAWSWWSEDYFGDPGVPEGYRGVIFSCARQKEYVDFAASMGWEYVTVDAGWAKWTDGSVAELCEYAAPKGIGIFIWGSPYVHTPYGASRMNIRKWAGWGVAGLKIDMTQNDSQVGMSFLEATADYCAELGLMVFFHNATKPGGENRTWPNVIGSEAVLGAEHYKLYWPPAPTAYHNCVLPFSRNVLGSMDYTPVALSNGNKNTTQAHQLALSIVFESRIQNYADSIDVYRVWKGAELLCAVPASWDETLVLGGFPGNYAIIARRNGADWYVGAITDSAGTAEIQLSCLGLEAGSYSAYIYKDGSAPEFLDKEIAVADSSTTLSIPMLKGGGCAILLSKATVPAMPADPYTPYEAEDAELIGAAAVQACANCSGGKKVGHLGFAGEIVFSVTVPAAGEYKVRLYYLTASERWIRCSVNGGPGVLLKIGLDSGSFDVVRIYGTSMPLDSGANAIRFYHDDWAPDLDKIGILVE